jgi:DNA polymerase-3 subunit delta'
MQYDAVIGQSELKERLQKSVRENRISHAQLFVGPEGSGALPMAVAYACQVLTENSQNPEATRKKCEKLTHPDLHFCFPVNTTKSVKKDPRSSHFLKEWREALLTNPYLNLYQWLNKLGIENKQGIIAVRQAEEIQQDLALKAFEASYKIMILWMPEKLHEKASNKLLKIIEEPPQKTLFILVSENAELLLPTIISRTQITRIPRLSSEELKDALNKRHNMDEASAQSAAFLSEGNYLEALRILNSSNEEMSFKSTFQNWMRSLYTKDIYEVMDFVEQIARVGRERQKHFLTYGLHIFRESLMANYATKDLVRTSGDEANFVEKFSPFIHAGNALSFASEFEEAIYHIERNVNAKIVFTDLSLKSMKLIRVKA